MRLDPGKARERFAAARCARLATADAAGVPHLVPVTFAVHSNVVAFAVDHKPKASTDLRRLRNIEANPLVSVLVDHYDEDWTRLWWVRADGSAAIDTTERDREGWIRLLVAKYPQYATNPPQGALVLIAVSRWSGWTA